jgi:putative membrane protein
MWVGGDGIMLVVMLLVAFAWLRSPSLRRRSSGGWLGLARTATLAAQGVQGAGGSAAAPTSRRAPVDVDGDEQALADYNAWLQGLARHRPPS